MTKLHDMEGTTHSRKFGLRQETKDTETEEDTEEKAKHPVAERAQLLWLRRRRVPAAKAS